jgi:hypothetical protein
MQRSLLKPLAAMATGILLSGTLVLAQSDDVVKGRFTPRNPPPMTHGTTIESRKAALSQAASSSLLPLWNYQVISSRDGNLYQGVIVGANPETRGAAATTNVPTQLVPIILKFHSVATAVNLTTGIISVGPGKATSDPTVADTACYGASNNVPLTLMEQSPVLTPANFNFGGTDVGMAQYPEAFSRANFWSIIDRANYHTRLSPVTVLPAVTLNVPAAQGLSLPANIFEPAFSMCGPEGLVNIDFIDAFVVGELSKLPGVTPGTFPMFMMYNSAMPIGDPTNLANCCAGGYHSINPVSSIGFQAYSPFDFDSSGFFVASANNSDIVSHESDEFINDPYIINDTPAWGHTGQVTGCQANLEVGDPLTGNNIQRIAQPNGFTYNLQELAFFSWFFGAPSLGIHGWFSDNDTFFTDAGPACM